LNYVWKRLLLKAPNRRFGYHVSPNCCSVQ